MHWQPPGRTYPRVPPPFIIAWPGYFGLQVPTRHKGVAAHVFLASLHIRWNYILLLPLRKSRTEFLRKFNQQNHDLPNGERDTSQRLKGSKDLRLALGSSCCILRLIWLHGRRYVRAPTAPKTAPARFIKVQKKTSYYCLRYRDGATQRNLILLHSKISHHTFLLA